MDHQPRAHRRPGSDPLLGRQAPTGRVDRSDLDPPRSGAVPQHAAHTRGPRRRHPAHGARALALTASVVATGAVGAGLAYSEGAWSGDGDAVASASDTTVPGPSSTTTETTTTTTPETTTPAEATGAASGYADGAYLGTAEYTEWGDVQVEVTITNGAIVAVAAVQYPTGRKSSSINDQAVPMLEAQAVALQSADLDIVSGATYTSRTYVNSLQAALDQAVLTSARAGGSA